MLALLVGTVPASQSLDQVLALAKSKAYRSRHVDWNSVERKAREIEISQGDEAAIRFVVAALADRHTSYMPPSRSSFVPPATRSAQPPIAVVLAQTDRFPVVQINGWAGKDQVDATGIVRSALRRALAGQRCGLVLDFSENIGGNMWPMLVGLGPLLTEGRLGVFRSADGTESRIEKKDGMILLDGQPHFLNYPRDAMGGGRIPYIAILLGPKSASSGEITPLMFRGQERVKYFGQRTAGFTSANQMFPLANGGKLVLTTAMTEDRNGRQHPDGIDPDVASHQPLEDASRWLRHRCAGR